MKRKRFIFIIFFLVAALAAGFFLSEVARTFLLTTLSSAFFSFWDYLKEAPPALFFTAFVLLPLFGCPVSPFYLLAPVLYGKLVSTLFFAFALFLHLALAYGLTRGVFRYLVLKMMARTRYPVPEVYASEYLKITLALRIAPGIPFPVQNYLLGLAGIPFWVYVIIPWPIQMAWITGFAFLGDALFKGKTGGAIVGLTLLAALVIIIKVLRDRYVSPSHRGPPVSSR